MIIETSKSIQDNLKYFESAPVAEWMSLIDKFISEDTRTPSS